MTEESSKVAQTNGASPPERYSAGFFGRLGGRLNAAKGKPKCSEEIRVTRPELNTCRKNLGQRRESPVRQVNLFLRALQRVPVLRVDQGFDVARVRVGGGIYFFVLTRLGMSVIQNNVAAPQVPIWVHTLEAFGRAGFLIHARGWPPKAAAPRQVRFRHRVSQQEVFRGADDGATFEPRLGSEVNSPQRYGLSSVGMDTEEKAVEPVADQVTIKFPLPPHTIIEPFSLYGWAPKEITLVVAVSDDGSAPPVCEGAARVIGVQSRIAMSWERVVAVVGVKLHKEADLAQIVQTRNALAFRFGPTQCRQEHACENRDNRDDDKQFDKCKRGPS